MRQAIVQLQNRRASRGHHAALLLQRYLCERATGEEGNPAEKRAILAAAISAARCSEVRALYEQAFERWKNALPDDAKRFELATDGRLIVGLGAENVLETGITLNHTFGMPIIPGSALKGLAAHYCHQVYGSGDDECQRKFNRPTPDEDKQYRDYLHGLSKKPADNYHRLLFGNTDDSGCIVFHDAWYVPATESSPLRLDVMTPHHPQWLDGSQAPTDFDSPTPVPFLSVVGTFHFALSWHGPATDRSDEWLAFAAQLLQTALADWGIGSKTTSGYGRLADPKKVTSDSRASAHESNPGPLPRARDEVAAVLLEEKTRKGGWRARHLDSDIAGPIQNSSVVPSDMRPGDEVRLIVASVNPKEIAFRFPTKEDTAQAAKAGGRKKARKPPRRRQ